MSISNAPTYKPSDLNPDFQLNWGLTLFWKQSLLSPENWLSSLIEATEPDGVRILKHRSISITRGKFFVSTVGAAIGDAVGDGDVFVTGEAEVDEPLFLEQPRRLLQQLDPTTVVLDQVVIRGKDFNGAILNWHQWNGNLHRR